MILILDDERHRHEGFDKLFEGAHVVHVWTVDDAIRKLTFGPRWDLVCLDNDLGTENFKREGTEVARFMATMPTALRPREVLVHSWNIDAAKEMYHLLREAHFDPIMAEFGTFKASIGSDGMIHFVMSSGKLPEYVDSWLLE